MALGLGFGFFAGLITYCTNYITNNQYFDDSYYWRNSDSIRYKHGARPAPGPRPGPEPIPIVDPRRDSPSNTVRSDSVVMDF